MNNEEKTPAHSCFCFTCGSYGYDKNEHKKKGHHVVSGRKMHGHEFAEMSVMIEFGNVL